MRSFNQRLWFAAGTLFFCAVLGCGVPPTHGDDSTQQWSTPAGADANAAFVAWAERYHARGTSVRDDTLKEGEALAAARSKELSDRFNFDPLSAWQAALPSHLTADLPASVSLHLERHVDGIGTLAVIASVLADGRQPSVRYLVEIGGERFNAVLTNPEMGWRTQSGVPIHGILLEGRMLVGPSALLPIEPEQAASFGLPIVDHCNPQAAAGLGSWFHAGDRIHRVCSAIARTVLEGTVGNGRGSGDLHGTNPVNAWTQGPKKMLFMRVDFSDAPGDPISLAGAQGLINTTLNNYFDGVSYHQTSITGTFPPTLRMPHPLTTYAVAGGDFSLLTDARAAALAAGYDTAQFDLDVVAFIHVGAFGYSGQAYVGGKGQWLNGAFSLYVSGHETGHNYGLNHAHSWSAIGDSIIGPGTQSEYGNKFDTMGTGGSTSTPFSSEYRNFLNWMPDAETQAITASGTYSIQALENEISSGLHAVYWTRPDGKRYWIEFRQALPSNAWLFNGALVNWSPVAGAGTVLLDMNPQTSVMDDAPLAIGRTFADVDAQFFLTPVSKAGTSPEALNLVVNLGPFPGNHSPTLSIAPSATTVAVSSPVNFTSTSADADGDALAYFWDFGDGTFGTNSASASKNWSAPGDYVVRCTVTDMKGGTATASAIITVGVASGFRVSGTVRKAGVPLEGVRITDGTRSVYTNSDGTYSLVGVPGGAYTVSAIKFDLVITPSFSNPVSVGANVTGIDFTAAAGAGYTVTGSALASSSGIAGVSVSDGTVAATTDGAGHYSLGAVADGFHNLNATKPGWVFTPSFADPLEVLGGNLGSENFFAVGSTISGKILGASAAATITDGFRTTTSVFSNGTWYYYLNTVPNGTWNLTATLPGSVITPNFTDPVLVPGVSVSGQDFTASVGTAYAIRGAITSAGQPLAGVAVTDGTRTSTTDGLGNYALMGVPNGSYTVTPTKASFTFVPANQSAVVSGADVSAIDFHTTATDAPPSIAVQPAASPAGVYTGTTTTLTVLGADDQGEASLIYTWSAPGATHPVSFSANGTHAAKSTVATFTGPGTYGFQVAVTDGSGQSVVGYVSVYVNANFTSASISPTNAFVHVNGSQQFSAAGVDQFGHALTWTPTFTWAVSGGGTLSATGLFSAGATVGGPFTVTATSGAISATTQVTITPANAPSVAAAASAMPNPVTGITCALSVLGSDPAGESGLTYAWTATTAPAPVTFSDNHTNSAKNATATFTTAGTYVLQVTLTNALSLSVTSMVAVTVAQTPTALVITPATEQVVVAKTRQFSATLNDQFGSGLISQPAFTWSTNGGGSVDPSGLFTAGAVAGGPFSLTAKAGALQGTSTITVIPVPPPTVTLVMPASNATLSGQVSFQATVSGTPAVAVDFFADGTNMGEVTAAPYNLTLDTTTLSDGAHTLHAEARSSTGQVGRSLDVPVTVRNGRGSPRGVFGCQSTGGPETGAWWLALPVALGIARRKRHR